MTTPSFFNIETQRDIIEKFSLPRDVFEKKIIKITDSSDENTNEQLVSIHYADEKIEDLLSGKFGYANDEITSILMMRGIVYDLGDKQKVCSSFPYTSVLKINHIPENRDYPIIINDAFGVTHNIPNNGQYEECFNGVLYRVFKYNNKVRGSTHRKIDAKSSHYGKSSNFLDIFLNNQSVFSSLDQIYDNCDEDDIHLFVLNDEELLIDTRDIHKKNKIIYLKTFSLQNPQKDCSYFKEKLMLLNERLDFSQETTKPIIFPQVLEPHEVNSYLRGDFICNININIDYTLPANTNIEMLKTFGVDALSLFSNSRKVIYQNELGIFTLISSPTLFRQHLINGNVNIAKLFIDCFASYGSSTSEKVLVPIGFSVESLREINLKIQNEEPYNLLEYQTFYDFVDLIILTNLCFCVPLHCVNECFDIYNNFGNMLKSACKFFILHKDRFYTHSSSKTLQNIEGMHSVSKGMKDYLSSTFPKCFDKKQKKKIDLGQNNKWPRLMRDFYNELVAKAAKSRLDEDYTNIAIASMIANATGQVLYSLVKFPEKHQATLNAHNRTRNSVKIPENNAKI